MYYEAKGQITGQNMSCRAKSGYQAEAHRQRAGGVVAPSDMQENPATGKLTGHGCMITIEGNIGACTATQFYVRRQGSFVRPSSGPPGHNSCRVSRVKNQRLAYRHTASVASGNYDGHNSGC
jgi:hypothetical protein